MPYGKIVIAPGKEAYFEIDGPYVGHVSAKGVVENLVADFNSIMDMVQETIVRVYNGFDEIPEIAKPDEYELSFGLKLSGDAGVVFAKVGSEGSFQIKLKWTA